MGSRRPTRRKTTSKSVVECPCVHVHEASPLKKQSICLRWHPGAQSEFHQVCPKIIRY